MPNPQLIFSVQHPAPPEPTTGIGDAAVVNPLYLPELARFTKDRFAIASQFRRALNRSTPVLTGQLQVSLLDLRILVADPFLTIYDQRGISYTPAVRRYQNWRRSGGSPRPRSLDFFSRSFASTQRYISARSYVSHILFERR